MPRRAPESLRELAARFAVRADFLRARADALDDGACDTAAERAALVRHAWAWRNVAGRVATVSEPRARSWLLQHLAARAADSVVGPSYAEMAAALAAYLATGAAADSGTAPNVPATSEAPSRRRASSEGRPGRRAR